ncbi:RING-H2 finger protein ATL63 [Gossypium australe]|uniref:RING-H2 finger protein ATL63 n=1 Tax=Gossypium australe TaxID=47621 RepID=A0A5B6UXK1_9ROSI|nr:RING-H2 finger protein ATL63 [Gossypium australe]
MTRNERIMREYALLNLDMVQGSIMRPAITTNNFEIKLAMIQMIQNNLQFQGPITENLSTKINYDMGRTRREIPTKGLPY